MSTCFVIQPFDAGKFDKRFVDVFAPAIKDAGLEAYRVDQDPKVEVPIDAIEHGIAAATVCLADITTDNPNVWYELGYAFASDRPVVMVCSDERTGRKYPFDIQHRTIISYRPDSTQDFEKLKQDIAARIKGLAQRGEAMRRLAEIEGKSFHCLRHTAASNQYGATDKAGLAAKLAEALTLDQIKSLLGHSDAKTTRRYIHKDKG